jgi:recombination endonuclease VII
MSLNCRKCGIELVEGNSTPTNRKRSWGVCHSCDNKMTHECPKYVERKERAVRWNQQHAERRSEILHDYHVSHREIRSTAAINLQRRQKYGITPEEFQIKFSAQAGLCAVCKKVMTIGVARSRLRACQDHDHETGQNRDILCAECNLLLGHCFENEEILANAILYLRKHKAAQNSEVPCVAFCQPVSGVDTEEEIPASLCPERILEKKH